MSVTLFDHTHDPERKIAIAASICYDSDNSEEAIARRINHLMKMRHLSCLRFAYATFKIEGISRVCSHQLVRHPHLSFLQRSQRYCNEAESDVVYPEGLDEVGRSMFDMGVAHTRAIYNALIDRGVKKGDARFILPQAASTELYVTGNFQAFYDMLIRRIDKAAQWEVRGVANAMLDELMRIAPNIFGELRKSTLQNAA